MPKRVVLSVGTKRGLFLMESTSGRRRWNIKGPFLKGWTVQHAIVDTRGRPRVHVAASNYTFGATTLSGNLDSEKFDTAQKPPVPPPLKPKQKKVAKEWGIDTAERVWFIEPGSEKQKKVLYAGTAPAGLFRSEDSGQTWEPIQSINEHRTRKDWNPGAGGMSMHSIQVDPHDPNRLYVAISAAGAFRSDDAGESWKPINDCVASYVGAPEQSLVGT